MKKTEATNHEILKEHIDNGMHHISGIAKCALWIDELSCMKEKGPYEEKQRALALEVLMQNIRETVNDFLEISDNLDTLADENELLSDKCDQLDFLVALKHGNPDEVEYVKKERVEDVLWDWEWTYDDYEGEYLEDINIE